MERSRPRNGWLLLAIAVGGGMLAAVAGCNVVATAVWLFKDGKTYPAECNDLKHHTVAVVCRGPMQIQFRHEAQAPQLVARNVNRLLKANLGKKIDLVPADKVAKVTDEKEWDEFTDVGKELGCDMVLGIDIEQFTFNKGSVYSGKAVARIVVYDMNQDGLEIFSKPLHNIEFPPTIGGVPATEMSEKEFMERFVRYVSELIGKKFYDHDPRADYASYGLD